MATCAGCSLRCELHQFRQRLRMRLLLSDRQNTQLVDAGTTNPEAYQLYLQASSIFNRRDRTRFVDAIAALKRAVELDPKYARAFARLVDARSPLRPTPTRI